MVSVMSQVIEGQVNDSVLADFLKTLTKKGERVGEIVGAALFV